MRFRRGGGDLGHFNVNRHSGVVEGRRLQNDTGSADDHGYRKDPKEQAIQHHSHVFPVLFDLRNSKDFVKDGSLVSIELLSAVTLIEPKVYLLNSNK